MSPLQYKPESWVQFKIGSAEAVGKIQGAIVNKGTWLYYITNAASTGTCYAVAEVDIIRTANLN